MIHLESVTTTAIHEAFAQDGYVVLRGFLSADVFTGVISELERWVDRQAVLLRDEGINSDLFADEAFPTRLARVYANCPDRLDTTLRHQLHWPKMFHLFFAPHLLDIVEGILGPEIRLYPNYSVRPKLPDHPKTEVLWHQDAGYTASGRHGCDASAKDLASDQLRMVNVWTPLVPARRENGCMQFVPRSHLLGLVPHLAKNEYYLEIAPASLEPHLQHAVDIEMDAGDVVLFSNLLFHRGLPNRSPMVRWSCDWRYQDATQSTMRTELGHIARSRTHPESVVQSAEQWASLSFR